jgi:uncharacterized protein YdaU (DUF1376 family)
MQFFFPKNRANASTAKKQGNTQAQREKNPARAQTQCHAKSRVKQKKIAPASDRTVHLLPRAVAY